MPSFRFVVVVLLNKWFSVGFRLSVLSGNIYTNVVVIFWRQIPAIKCIHPFIFTFPSIWGAVVYASISFIWFYINASFTVVSWPILIQIGFSGLRPNINSGARVYMSVWSKWFCNPFFGYFYVMLGYVNIYRFTY